MHVRSAKRVTMHLYHNVALWSLFRPRAFSWSWAKKLIPHMQSPILRPDWWRDSRCLAYAAHYAALHPNPKPLSAFGDKNKKRFVVRFINPLFIML
jgi:hypothetical protein